MLFLAMIESEAKSKIALLSEQIRQHDQNYYVLAAPVISDLEYDRLMRELLDLESQFPKLALADSPT